jgi:hypothetical protein
VLFYGPRLSRLCWLAQARSARKLKQPSNEVSLKQTPESASSRKSHGRLRPSGTDLRSVGVNTRRRADSANLDILGRFLDARNHAIFLHTSEDKIIELYIREHWDALDGLSGEACDIYVSLLQLQGGEDSYSKESVLRFIPGLEKVAPSSLPSLHLWSDLASVTLSLEQFDSETKLTRVFRSIFTLLRSTGGPLNPSLRAELIGLVDNSGQSTRSSQGKGIHMETKYVINGGSFGVVGDNTNFGDLTQLTTGAQQNLSDLATELDKLYIELKLQASTPEEYQAVGKIADARDAATRNDLPSALNYLRSAGSWVWDIATKVGIGVATSAAKTALGL